MEIHAVDKRFFDIEYIGEDSSSHLDDSAISYGRRSFVVARAESRHRPADHFKRSGLVFVEEYGLENGVSRRLCGIEQNFQIRLQLVVELGAVYLQIYEYIGATTSTGATLTSSEFISTSSSAKSV